METERSYGTRGKNKVKLKEPNLYDVVMLNDDFTPMDFVVDMLRIHFDKTEEEATALMLLVHKTGRSVVATYVYDVAMTKSYKVIQEAREKGYPFKVVVEKKG